MPSVNSMELVLKNAPIETEVLGMRSDTYTLQQAGWQFAVDQDFHKLQLRVIMKHSVCGLYVQFGPVNFDYFDYFALRDPTHPTVGLKLVAVNISSRMKQEIITMPDKALDFSRYKSADMAPMMVNRKIQDIEDFGLFTTPKVRTQEIIVPEYEVKDLMQMILDKQKPLQEEYSRRKLKNKMLEEHRQTQTFHAQIISVA